MGCGCCTTGKNEKETLKNELGWLAGWAEGFARDLLTVEQALLPYARGGFSNGIHSSWGDSSDYTKEELCARLDAVSAMIGGLRREMIHLDDDRKNLLPVLIQQIRDCKKIAEGKKAIVVEHWYEYQPVRDFIGADAEQYEIVRIEGDEDFFMFKNESEVYKHLRDAIENEIGGLPRQEKGKEARSDKKIALVFCDEETADHILSKRLNLIQGIAKMFPGLRVFYHKDSIAEIDFQMPGDEKKYDDKDLSTKEVDN